MVKDEEGFLYPKVDMKKCIECGKCKKVCPVLNKKKRGEVKEKGYIFQYKDNDIRKQSTSGGAFTAIADYVIENKGVVFGACFDEKFNLLIFVTPSTKLATFLLNKEAISSFVVFVSSNVS